MRAPRRSDARELLAKNKIDALVAYTGTSLNYFTGLTWGRSSASSPESSPSKGGPFVVCPVFEEGRVRRRMEAKPATLPQASVTKVYTWNETDSPYTLSRGPQRSWYTPPAKIGVESAHLPSPTASPTPALISPRSAEPPSPLAAAL
jgi:Xaa-Pro dipeptidase